MAIKVDPVGQLSPAGSMPTRPSTGKNGPLAWWWLAVLIAAVLPSLGSLTAPLISDDGAILGYVHENGALADWTSSQYDLHAVQFWRPLVTSSFAIQEAFFGVESFYFRIFNLFGHAISAVILGLLAIRLGAGRIGGLLAGLLCAWFPEQGGNVTWIAGRVDSLCVPFLLLSVLMALDKRQGFALLAGFLALATKELAVVTPVWIALLTFGSGERPIDSIKRALPVGFLVLGVGVWRRLALGTWVGGYQSQGLSSHFFETFAESSKALSDAFGAELFLLIVCLALTLGSQWKGRTLATLGCAIAAALPLIHVLSTGSVPAEHARTLWLADCGLALSLACCFQVSVSTSIQSASLGGKFRVVALLLVVLLAAYRGDHARVNVEEWTAGAELAESQIESARKAVASDPVQSTPALSPNFSRITDAGAYVLHWGVADRFRAPFAASPRPVWPWRPVMEVGGSAALRELCFELEAGVARPSDERGRLAPKLSISIEGGATEGPLRIDSSFAIEGDERDPSPRLFVEFEGELQPVAWEILFVSELGYRPALIAGATNSVEFSLRDAMLQVADAFALAIDFHCEQGYLEVRALGADNQVLASSPWIELVWERDDLNLWR
ncbi:MAG: hypothetical protein ACI8TQ_000963 [Planctomycetota bacterium]|jgi:hypothetical protein